LEIELYERQLQVLSNNEEAHKDILKTNKNTRVSNWLIGGLTLIIAIGTFGSMIQQCNKDEKQYTLDQQTDKVDIQEQLRQPLSHHTPQEEVSTEEVSQERIWT